MRKSDQVEEDAQGDLPFQRQAGDIDVDLILEPDVSTRLERDERRRNGVPGSFVEVAHGVRGDDFILLGRDQHRLRRRRIRREQLK